jgi:hypothetical protein
MTQRRASRSGLVRKNGGTHSETSSQDWLILFQMVGNKTSWPDQPSHSKHFLLRDVWFDERYVWDCFRQREIVSLPNKYPIPFQKHAERIWPT